MVKVFLLNNIEINFPRPVEVRKYYPKTSGDVNDEDIEFSQRKFSRCDLKTRSCEC